MASVYDKQVIIQHLNEHGWVVIPNILSQEKINKSKEFVKEFQNGIENYDKVHNSIDPHGIHKYHNAGHTRMAWLIRTDENVQKVFKDVWNTDELIVSFDGF